MSVGVGVKWICSDSFAAAIVLLKVDANGGAQGEECLEKKEWRFLLLIDKR